jgi:DNA-binding transcriptional LysR family regulator
MDPQQLRTFVAVVDLCSFSGAARSLGYTQSAVSQHIAALEADLGTPLLTRRPVAVTAAGERLLEHARPLLLRLEAARADIARLRRPRPGRLALACTPGSLTPVVADALVRARVAEPRLDVTVRVAGREEVVREVLSGAADLALVDGVAAPSDPLTLPDTAALTALTVAQEPLTVLLPVAHPLAGRRGLRLADLAAARWIDAPDCAVPLAQLRSVARSDGFGPRLLYAGTDVRGLATVVAAGGGLTALSGSMAGGWPGVTAVPVTEPRVAHRTELLHPHSPGAEAAGLVEALGPAR